MGDKRPNFLQKFWDMEDFRMRKQFNGSLRNGGSMSADVYADLQRHTTVLSSSSSRLEIIEENEVVQAHYKKEEDCIHIRFEDGRLEHFDFVWLATGGAFDLELVPIFASLQRQSPIPNVDGLPGLQPDLSWASNVPNLYVMGAFAQLQLGADALNLAGARSGGVVVARSLLIRGEGFNLSKNLKGKGGSGKIGGGGKKRNVKDNTSLKLPKLQHAVMLSCSGFVTKDGKWETSCC